MKSHGRLHCCTLAKEDNLLPLRRILEGAVTIIHLIKSWSLSVCFLKIPNDKFGNTFKELLLLTEVWGLFLRKSICATVWDVSETRTLLSWDFFACKDWQNIFIQTWVMGLLHLLKKISEFLFQFYSEKMNGVCFLSVGSASSIWCSHNHYFGYYQTSVCNFCFDILPSCFVGKKAELGNTLKLSQSFLYKWLVGWVCFWS